MRKYILIIAFAIGCLCTANAQELNASQVELRNRIQTFIREEGFVPSLDSDGDIVFKSEGQQYWISVSAEDDVPMFVSLNIGFNNPSGYSLKSIKLAAAELNNYKGVKTLCFEDSFVIRAELYVMDAEQFKYSFYKMLEQVKSATHVFMDICDKYKESKSVSTKYSSSTTSSQRSATSSSPSSNSNTQTSSSSNISGTYRTIYAKETTIKVGERIVAQLPEGRIDRWEINQTQIQHLRDMGDGSITALKEGNMSVWGYVNGSPRLFKFKIVGKNAYVPADRPPYQVSSKEFTMYVGDQITANISEGFITRWEINSNNKAYLSADGNVLRAIKAGDVVVWGYVKNSPKHFKIRIKTR